MIQGWEIREERKSRMDEAWVTSAVDLLAALPFDERETIACALDEKRHKRLREEKVELPEGIRLKYFHFSNIQAIAGRMLLAKPAAERLAILEMLSPLNGWAIEAGLLALRHKPLGPAISRTTVRAGEGELLERERAQWLLPAIAMVGSLRVPLAEMAGLFASWHDKLEVWSWVLAGAIDAGGERGEGVYRALMESVRGEGVGDGTTLPQIHALLRCSRVEAWECMERLLLGAQRQEGLRLAILGLLHQSHPGAFARLAGVIVEDRLCRFSSVVRAANGWFGLGWDLNAQGFVERQLGAVVRYLRETGERETAVKRGTTEEVFFALWAAGFESADSLISLAARAFADKRESTRYAAACVLARTGMSSATDLLRPVLDDPELRVALAAAAYFGTVLGRGKEKPNVVEFEALERLLHRVENRKQRIVVDESEAFVALPDRGALTALMLDYCPASELRRMLPYVDRMEDLTRREFVLRLEFCRRFGPEDGDRDGQESDGKELPVAVRRLILGFHGDPSNVVASAAMSAMKRQTLEDDEVAVLKVLARRNAPQLRALVFERLLKRPPEWAVEYAGELLEGRTEASRVLGLELCVSMVQRKKGTGLAKDLARRFRASGRELGKREQLLVATLVGVEGEQPRRAGAFGLVDTAKLTKPVTPRALPVLKMTDAAWEVLADFVRIVNTNKARMVRQWEGAYPVLLGNMYPSSSDLPRDGESIAEGWARCPAADLLQEWFATRRPETRDADGLELLRAALVPAGYRRSGGQTVHGIQWPKRLVDAAHAAGMDLAVLSRPSVEMFRAWALWLEGDRGYAKILLDSAEGALHSGADLPFTESTSADYALPRIVPDDEIYARPNSWIGCLQWLEDSGLVARDRTRAERVWRLAVSSRAIFVARTATLVDKSRHWVARELGEWHLASMTLERLLDAVLVGCMSEDDVLDVFTQAEANYELIQGWAMASWQATVRTVVGPPSALALQRAREAVGRAHPVVVSASSRLRQRIVDVELSRTEVPTEASGFARSMMYSGGADVCVRCLAALQPQGPQRVVESNDYSRRGVLTHLVAASYPAADETPEKVASLAKAAGLTEKSLSVLGVLAPQWVEHVEKALGKGWVGYEDAVWWVHAHLGPAQYGTAQHLIEKRNAIVAERTRLNSADVADGAVDADWFWRVLDVLGLKRWGMVSDAAGYGRNGNAYTRVQFFTDAMLGRKGATERELMTRVKAKRHQDSVRALGLVPLKKGAARAAQILERYKLMQEIRRTSRKKGGSMRQASEKRAVEIGMDNLARTAGFADPLRLHWAMERLELGDLASGSVVVMAGDFTVTLTLDGDGEPVVQATKKGKALGTIPASARKHEAVAALVERAAELRRQRPRIRQSLEAAMCRGDTFLGSEIAQLWEHPTLRKQLQLLVFVVDSREGISGYPDSNGKVLRDHRGNVEPLEGSDVLRIAHPLDLLARKDWHLWQRECFSAERIQPFKQVFREVYVPMDAERGKVTESGRYEGHQVQPRQALALLGGRGWITRGDEGTQLTFHKERVTAHLEFTETFYTSAEVQTLTLRTVRFNGAGHWNVMAIGEVPGRVFSETMRDLDLVVSVAHRSGVDPEASQSTVEMRASLVKETAAMLRLSNVKVEKTRVAIRGALAEYSVHLGSANVQVLPGGSVCIVPIAAEHRGRLFLPFADSDPKTAEVMSKVLLLARDKEIQDPSILVQIRRLT